MEEVRAEEAEVVDGVKAEDQGMDGDLNLVLVRWSGRRFVIESLELFESEKMTLRQIE